MSLTLVTPPAEEPVTVLEAKGHSRIDATAEDWLVLSWIVAARRHLERISERRFITQTWDWTLDYFPCDVIDVPYPPLQEIVSVSYIDDAGATQVLDPAVYQVDIKSDPGRIALGYNQSWPSIRSYVFNPITVRFKCGYGLHAKVPEDFKEAMYLLIGHFNEHREAVTDVELFETPMALRALMTPFTRLGV